MRLEEPSPWRPGAVVCGTGIGPGVKSSCLLSFIPTLSMTLNLNPCLTRLNVLHRTAGKGLAHIGDNTVLGLGFYCPCCKFLPSSPSASPHITLLSRYSKFPYFSFLPRTMNLRTVMGNLFTLYCDRTGAMFLKP